VGLLVKKRSRIQRGKSSPENGPQRKAIQGLSKPNPAATSLKPILRKLFGIDPRSLALFRIAMGLLLLADLAVRATDLNVMYTDDGMFPRAEVCRRFTTIWNWSFHFGGGSAGYQAMLFGLAALLALALLAGFETRLATIGSWLMLISIHHRVPPILSGAELLFRTLLLWAIFLPLERAWSVDGWRDKRRNTIPSHDREAPVVSVGSTAILLQMALMYFFSAIYKSNAQWFHGDVIAGSLTHDFFAVPLGATLLRYPRLLAGLTWATLALEWVGPLLLFSPKYTGRLRIATITALAAMHIGICLCLDVGWFSYVALTGLTLFLPAEFWNSRLLAVLRPTEPGAGSRALIPAAASSFSFLPQSLCLLLLIYVLAMNLNSLPSHPLAPLRPEKWKPMTTTLGLAQRWAMFEAIPTKSGWYVGRARLHDGSEGDLLRHGAALDWNKPAFPVRLYPNRYWVKLFREMTYYDQQGFQVWRAPVAKYLCRQWNAHHPTDKQIVEFEFIFCMENKAEGVTSSGGRIFREQLVYLDLSGPWMREDTPAPGQAALQGGTR
jgi:hypothetical protein